jgi:hypothetical protein
MKRGIAHEEIAILHFAGHGKFGTASAWTPVATAFGEQQSREYAAALGEEP